MNLMVSDLDYGQAPSLDQNLDPYALAKALSGRHLIGGELGRRRRARPSR